MTPSPLSQPPTKEEYDMYTLALPTPPVNAVRAVACGLGLACATLVPLPSHAFTYDVLAGSVIVQHQVVSLQRAGKYKRPVWRPSQGQKGIDERALMASPQPSPPS